MTDSSTQVNTAGGSAIEGDVKIDQGDFVGRDKIEHHYHYTAGIQPPTATPATPRGIFGLYPFNEHFFGRDEELATLHRLLQTESNVSICPVITGMGGLGKTQLAAHYARAHIADYPDGIFWVTAANFNEIRPQLADFCVALGLPVADPQRSSDLTEQKISAFKGYLDQHLRALLIFDNVEEPDHLRTHQIGIQLTALMLGGKVIVTTRRRKVANDKFAELALQRLLPAPARQILTTARPDLAADPDLDRLCEQFGYLPLMLNLATAALKKRGGTIAGYLQRLHTLGAEQLHGTVAKVNLDDYHKSLTVVLQEQWSMLQDDNARLLLRVAGQLPEATLIPTARLGLLAGLVDVDEWERPLSDALEELERTSLVEGVDQETLRLHPLVRDFAAAMTRVSDYTIFRMACAQRLDTVYRDMKRLGHEYAKRGIGALLVDLMTAIDLAQSTEPMAQSPLSSLHTLLRHLRLESHHLQTDATNRQPQRLWQQLLPRMPPATSDWLTQHSIDLLSQTLHWLPHWSHQRQSLSIEQTLTGHEGAVFSLAVLDNQRLVSTSGDHTLKVWNLTNGQVEQTLFGHQSSVNAVAVVDSRRIVSASDDHTLKVWNLLTGQVEQTLIGHQSSVNAVAVVDNQRIVSASNDHTLKVWNLTTSQVEYTFSDHKRSVWSVIVAGTQHIVSASDDRTIKIWNLANGQLEQTFTGHERAVWSIALVNTHRIVSASSDRTLKIWNLANGQLEQTLAGHEDWVNAVAVVDSQRIVSASADHTLKVWNLMTGQIEQTLSGHERAVLDVVVVDNQYIVSASDDRTLKVWHFINGQIKETLTGHERAINDVAALDSQRVVSASADHTLKIWNLMTGQVEQTLSEHERAVNAVAVLDSKRIVSASSDRTTRVWNLNATHNLRSRTNYASSVLCVAVMDKRRVVSAASDGTVNIWNIMTGQVKQSQFGHKQSVLGIAAIANQRIISASTDRTIKVWNLDTDRLELTLADHKDDVTSIALIDGHRIISTSADRTIKVWNLDTAHVELTLAGHEDNVTSVAVIDGCRIVSASSDRTLKVWDLKSGRVLASIGLDGSLECVAVTRQGDRTLVVAGDAGGALYCLELVEPVGADKMTG